MENNPILDSEMETGLTLSSDARAFLFETSRWAQFLAILGFVAAGFMALTGLGIMALGGAMAQSFAQFGFPPALFGLFYIVLAVIYIFPSMYLYQFATKGKQALQGSNSALLTESLGGLKSTFKFYGIFAIAVIGLYFLAILIGIVAGGAGLIGG